MADVNFRDGCKVCLHGGSGAKLKPGIEFCDKIGYKEKLPETQLRRDGRVVEGA